MWMVFDSRAMALAFDKNLIKVEDGVVTKVDMNDIDEDYERMLLTIEESYKEAAEIVNGGSYGDGCCIAEDTPEGCYLRLDIMEYRILEDENGNPDAVEFIRWPKKLNN